METGLGVGVCPMWALQVSSALCHAKKALTLIQEDARRGTSKLLCFPKCFLAPILAAGILGSLDSFRQKEARTPWDKADRQQSPDQEGKRVKE